MKFSILTFLALLGYASAFKLAFDCVNRPDGKYPNVEDCKTFYKCSNGYTHLYNCPDNLDFDAPSLTCEWPHLAKCATNGCDGKVAGWWHLKDCNGHEHGDLYPDPYDCGSFYQCSWGTAYHFKCPSILHFNNEIKVCDWPWDAKCELECPPEPTEAPTTTTAAPSPTSEEPSPTTSAAPSPTTSAAPSPTTTQKPRPTWPTWPTFPTWPSRPTWPPLPTWPTRPTKPTTTLAPSPTTTQKPRPTWPTFPTWPSRPTWPPLPTWPTRPTKPTTTAAPSPTTTEAPSPTTTAKPTTVKPTKPTTTRRTTTKKPVNPCRGDSGSCEDDSNSSESREN